MNQFFSISDFIISRGNWKVHVIEKVCPPSARGVGGIPRSSLLNPSASFHSAPPLPKGGSAEKSIPNHSNFSSIAFTCLFAKNSFKAMIVFSQIQSI
jgi:hypothetical protein